MSTTHRPTGGNQTRKRERERERERADTFSSRLSLLSSNVLQVRAFNLAQASEDGSGKDLGGRGGGVGKEGWDEEGCVDVFEECVHLSLSLFSRVR